MSSRSVRVESRKRNFRKTRVDGLRGSIYKTFKEVATTMEGSENWSMSRNALAIATEIAKDVLAGIAGAAVALLRRSNTKTVDARTVGFAVQQLMRDELLQMAQLKARGAIEFYRRRKIGRQSERAQLTLSVARVAGFVRKNLISNPLRVSAEAFVYFTAVTEYILDEIFSLAAYSAKKDKKKRIYPRQLMLAVFSDKELKEMRMFKSAVFAKSGTYAPPLVAPKDAGPKKPAPAAKNRKKAAVAVIAKAPPSIEPKILANRLLTPVEVKLVQNAWQNVARDAALRAKLGEEIAQSLPRLRSGAWLNDICINEYLGMLKRSAATDARSFYRTHVFNSYFMPMLSKNGQGYDYRSVEKWTRKTNLFDFDLILVPVHDSGVHWALAVINIAKKRFEFYDSLGSDGAEYLTLLRKYLQDEVENKKLNISIADWQIYAPKDKIPQQTNGWDCGIFTLEYARRLLRKSASKTPVFQFAQKDVEKFRQRITLDFLEEKKAI